MYITQWWPPTRRSQWVHRDPVVFAKDVGIEIVDHFQRYCVIYINKTIQESACTLCGHGEQHLFECSKNKTNNKKNEAPPFGFRVSVLFILWLNAKSIVLLGYWGHLSISVFIMTVQISCWAWVWGGAFETDGRVAGTLGVHSSESYGILVTKCCQCFCPLSQDLTVKFIFSWFSTCTCLVSRYCK